MAAVRVHTTPQTNDTNKRCWHLTEMVFGFANRLMIRCSGTGTSATNRIHKIETKTWRASSAYIKETTSAVYCITFITFAVAFAAKNFKRYPLWWSRYKRDEKRQIDQWKSRIKRKKIINFAFIWRNGRKSSVKYRIKQTRHFSWTGKPVVVDRRGLVRSPTTRSTKVTTCICQMECARVGWAYMYMQFHKFLIQYRERDKYGMAAVSMRLDASYIYVSVTTDHFRIIIRISNDFGQFHPSPCLHPIAVLCTWLGQTRFWPMHCIGSETGLDILVCVKWSFGCCGCCGNDNFCGHLATAGPRNTFLSRWHVICAVLHCALSRRDCYLPSQTERKHKPNFASKQFTPSSAMKNIAFIRL